MENQEKVWDSIAKYWQEFRETPSPAVADFLKDKKGKILDLGSGSGRNFAAFPKKVEIYAVDFSEEMLKFAEKNAAKRKLKVITKKSDSSSLPFEKDFFDSAICIAVLHCIPEKSKRINTIKEIYRTLKPKSQCFISVWGKNSPRIKNKGKECFVPWTTSKKAEQNAKKQLRYTYIYDQPELEKEVRSAGFKILQSWEERNLNIIAEK